MADIAELQHEAERIFTDALNIWRSPEIAREMAKRGEVLVVPFGSRRCRPGETIERLLNRRRLPRFLREIWDDDLSRVAVYQEITTYRKESNCHNCCFALMLDLASAGEAKGWEWCEGVFSPSIIHSPQHHSWLECDGWAIEAMASGQVFIMERAVYYSVRNAGANVIRRDVDATLAYAA
jgi:hypothetical protein